MQTSGFPSEPASAFGSPEKKNTCETCKDTPFNYHPKVMFCNAYSTNGELNVKCKQLSLRLAYM